MVKQTPRKQLCPYCRLSQEQVARHIRVCKAKKKMTSAEQKAATRAKEGPVEKKKVRAGQEHAVELTCLT